MSEERCPKTHLPRSGCGCDRCRPDPIVYATKYGQWYHDRPDCPGIEWGHWLAESHDREVHPPERLRRWEAESRGLYRHECPPRDPQPRAGA